MSRTNEAADQVRGEAEPAAPPFLKPIEASVGSVPNGEAARSGRVQFCSGINPTPEANALMPCSSDAAPAASPAASKCSARSAESAGQTCPVPCPLGAHGRPSLPRSP